MNTIKVKICGITNYEDASMAVSLGADALGFIFASSLRRITPDDARDIIKKLPPLVKSVGVFVNEDPEVIEETVEHCGIDLVQLHGDESPEFCERFMPRSIKALRIKNDSMLQTIEAYKGKVKAFLLDSYLKGMAGGTGKSFDWDLAIEIKKTGVPVILAGGLGPENIEKAVSKVKPYAIDVNSGIEESPGKKNHDLMKKVFEKINKIE